MLSFIEDLLSKVASIDDFDDCRRFLPLSAYRQDESKSFLSGSGDSK
jgi:hypothetical protein